MGKTFQLSCALCSSLSLFACTGAADAPEPGAEGGFEASAAGRGGAGSGSAGSGGAGSGGASSGGASSGGASSGGNAEVAGASAEVGGCRLFPGEDAWNVDISGLPADPDWTRKVAALAPNARLHPDYGSDGDLLYGIPLNVVPEGQPRVPVSFDWYPEESDAGPYPFPGPRDVRIEGNDPESCEGDCHLLVVEQGSCELFEGYACEHRDDGWHCGNGAKWDLNRVGLGQRPKGFTSADAAGLAIAPGLLRLDEVRSGELTHALRFTLACTTDKYVAPAQHYAVPGSCDPTTAPPMGTRVRLRADFDLSDFGESARVVLRGMQRYGMILADNGSNFYFQGEAHPDWTEEDIEPLKRVPASAFEVVQMPPLEP
jgi:hypothetical protein